MVTRMSEKSVDDRVAVRGVQSAEREGLRLALLGRSVVLVVAALWMISVGSWPSGKLAGLAILGFALVGLGYRRIVGSRWDFWAFPYALLSIDIVAVAAIFAFVPLSQSDDVPQIFAFRAYGIYYFLIFLGAVALTFSPRLLLWSGGMIVAAWWGAFWIATSAMETTLSWGDLPSGAGAEDYIGLILDPNFVGVGNRIEESIAILATAGLLAFAVARQKRVLHRWIQADRQRTQVREIFGRFVPEQVSRLLVTNGGTLIPERRQATVLFLDVAGFTAFSESRSPQDVIAAMDALFTLAGRVVSDRGGVIVGYQGDGLMAAFNAPGDLKDHAAVAVETALSLIDAIESEVFSGSRLKVRIGVHTGPVAAGLIGGGARQTYTVYGDTVNVASRLEQACKSLGVSVLISDATVERAEISPSETRLRDHGAIDIPGHGQPVRVFSPAQSQTV